MYQERYELAINRIREIVSESLRIDAFTRYFRKVAEFILLLDDVKPAKECNQALYSDILPENYDKSYANPDYICGIMEPVCGLNIARMLCFIYSEMIGLIPYAYEHNIEILTLYLELFIQVYVAFSDEEIEIPDEDAIKSIIYSFNFDNCDTICPMRLKEQLDPELDFALGLIMDSDLSNTDYLYEFGEYISDDEIKVCEFLNTLSQDEIDSMASTFTEGYRIGFVKAGKPLEKKKTVNIRYNLGFERIVRAAVIQFEKMGLKSVIYRNATLSINKRGQSRVGYFGAIPNRQFDYDHREDCALYMDKDFVNRKTDVIKEAYEKYRVLANFYGGPAVIETFGEKPFSPEQKNTCIPLDVVGRKCQIELIDHLSQLSNEYIKGEESSYTIIAYPIPAIGDDFSEIFRETVKLNTLDYTRYEKMQQIIIDVLDTATEVKIEGKGANKTSLTVKIQKITDATKQTVFENCVADVNIPVGEVFTSPVLSGTNGILNVSDVYLNGLEYIGLEIEFKDGMVKNYTCYNFETEEENKRYIKENLLNNHDTFPLGEFAIGTNTTAYKMARKFKIESRLPILIGEKTGPHFAIGDTCYSHEEDVKVYNPDGKEIISRDNEITTKYRKDNPSKAYFNCHTDITIPFDELGGIYAVRADGFEIAVIEDGKFVLPGLEELNEPLNE